MQVYSLTHKGLGSVLHDGPALLGLQQERQDPGVVLVVEPCRNALLLIHQHVGVSVRQLAVNLLQLP